MSPDPRALRVAGLTLALFGTAVGVPAVSSATEPPVVQAAPVTAVQAHCTWPPQVRPRRIVLTCADANDQYRRLDWTHWGSLRATATGQEWVNDCRPSCAGGTFHAYPVRVRLTGVWRTHGFRIFHRATFTFTGAHKPAGLPWHGHRLLPPYERRPAGR